MTLPATARYTPPFSGNGAATSFPFTFKVFAKTDIEVVVVIASIESTLVLDSDYSVALNADQVASPGGTVTYPISGAALATGDTLTIAGALPYDQTTDLPSGGSFSATALENALDRTVMQVQQLAGDVGRTLQLSITTPTGVDVTLPAPEADSLLGWDATGAALRNYTPATGTVADVLVQLASTAAASKGAGLVGALWTLNYAARTVGNDLRYGSMPSIFTQLSDAQQADVLAYGYSLDLTSTIAAAYALCKTWYFPAGGYKLSGATGLTMPGNGSVLTGDGDLTVINYTGTGTAIDLNGKYYCELSRFKLTTSTGAVGVDMPISSHFWQIDKLHIYGFSTAGVRGTSCYYGTLQRSDIEQCGAGLLGVQDFNGNFINNNSFRGNLRAIWIRDVALNSDGNQIINNEMEDSGRASVVAFVDIEGADGTIIMANRMESSVAGLTADIYIHGGTGIAGNNKVCDNYVAGSSTDVPSIRIGAGSGLGTKNTTVRDNTCLSATSGNFAVVIDTDATYTSYTGHRRDLGDGTFDVSDLSASTVLDYVDDSGFSVGITGLTTAPTVQWRYQVACGVVTLFAQTINGTSNTTGCTITGLPALIRPTNSQTVLLKVQENGTTQLGQGVVDSSGVITLSSDVAGAAFTASGSKGFIGCVITYPLN